MDNTLNGIAIIGMSGRFPGAQNVADFWKNLCNGIESLSVLRDEDLHNSGISDELINNPDYVKRIGHIARAKYFDADFFNINPREAELIDPQHRIFLECAWEAIEDAGYDTSRYDGLIGVFAGNGMNNYLIHNIAKNEELLQTVGDYQVMIGNANDYLSTRVSYKLNLKGPSITVQTACSTSMVAIHTACQNLLSYQCDMALAGAVSLKVPRKTGYLYQKGHILSPDGHCRAFDIKANGTAWGEGAGIVLLKRLEDAINERDSIIAVIKSSAINNDGSEKVGYTAPSVNGQASAIAMAQALADIRPQDVSYVEAHGTGTQMGDPIELAGLQKAFGSNDDSRKYCAIGSVKTNIGHLDAASGVAGIIKTALALKKEVIPPTLHFTEPNPNLNLKQSPFYINTTPLAWKRSQTPRYAGVSSFGIGGTNSHAILQEAPEIISQSSEKKWHILPISAKSNAALDKATENLCSFFKENSNINIGDAAYTLQNGRRLFPCRRTIVCSSATDAISAIESQNEVYFHSGKAGGTKPSAVFMFSGQGSQYVNMSEDLYNSEPVYRKSIDYCCSIITPMLGMDLKSLIFPGENEYDLSAGLLSQTQYTQPALFAIEYSIATLLMHFGIKPDIMIGHSIGEYVAACLAGVFTPEDAMKLIVNRARIMQEQPKGVMLSVSASESQVRQYLDNGTEVALVNSPQLCVAGGTQSAIEQLEEKLSANKIRYSRLHTSHAFHTSLMQNAVDPFIKCFDNIRLSAPSIPFVSNVTGTWITAEQTQSPEYWASHLRNAVQFASSLKCINDNGQNIFVEIGPGNSLCTLLSMQAPDNLLTDPIQTIRGVKQQTEDCAYICNALGQLWINGIQIDWKKYYDMESRFRTQLPTYPFERKRYWINSPHSSSNANECSDETSAVSQSLIKPGEKLSYDSVLDQIFKNVRNLLGVATVSKNDNFFDLGGDSLWASKFTSQLQKSINTTVDVYDIFSHPVFDDLCKILVNRISGSSAESRMTGQSDTQSEAQSDTVNLNQTSETFFYFNSQNVNCLGILHSPDKSSTIKETGIVICSPVYHEYTRSHHALRLLAERLSAAGFHVLRFDYFDHGDSWGNTDEDCYSIWKNNILDASQELTKRTHVSNISFLGLRLGATLAADICDNGFALQNLILWDPVFSGREYLAETKHIEKEFFAFGPQLINKKHKNELIGYSYPEKLKHKLKKTDIASMKLTDVKNIFIIDSERKSDHPIINRLTENSKIQHFFCPSNSGWNDPTKFYNMLIVNNVINGIVKKITEL